jgi:hypothetical protein
MAFEKASLHQFANALENAVAVVNRRRLMATRLKVILTRGLESKENVDSAGSPCHLGSHHSETDIS